MLPELSLTTGPAAPLPPRPAWAGRLWRSDVWHKRYAFVGESSLAARCCPLTPSSPTPGPARTTRTLSHSTGHSSGRATIAITLLWMLLTSGIISLRRWSRPHLLFPSNSDSKSYCMFNYVHPFCSTLCLVLVLYHLPCWLTFTIALLVGLSCLSCMVQQSFY